MGGRSLLTVLLVSSTAVGLSAQTTRQLSIVQAESRRAHTARDLAILRSGAARLDSETAVLAVRALGRLERPAVLPELLLALRSRFPEVRAEAAAAIGQAASGWGNEAPAADLARVLTSLTNRLDVDNDADVRASVLETLGRLPYTSADQVAQAEAALVDTAEPDASITDKLGIAQGLEWLARLQRERKTLEPSTIALLDAFAVPDAGIETAPRIRRLAVAALMSAKAVDDTLVARAATDPDEQVRRLVMRAAATLDSTSAQVAGLLEKAATDPVAMVRLEALRSAYVRGRGDPAVCALNLEAAADPDTHVALLALDQLDGCGDTPRVLTLLELTAGEVVDPSRGAWQRAAHALVSLAAVAPERASALVPKFVRSSTWQARAYAARAAGRMHDSDTLRQLAVDADDNVCETALDQLRLIDGHAADDLYVAALSRTGYQAARAAAYGLVGSPHPGHAVPALQAALRRLTDQGYDNSLSARSAIRAALVSLDADPDVAEAAVAPHASDMTLDEWRRLASARARITIRDMGTIDLALLTDLAPQTVVKFAQLAEAGYYNGLTFHRVVPNFVVQGGSPGANEYVGYRDFMNDEVSRWSNTRGAVGLSTRGRDTGDAQFFINLVDNPRLDHEYTVFAHVLAGLDVADAIIEGDVIEKIEILTTP
jgi:cyclophilin family peptidyl-prolyl cis-trans isomerase